MFLCLFFTVSGCLTVKGALENYEACKGDQVCMAEMSKVQEASYVVTKSVSNNSPIPSLPEVLAVFVSNLISFGYGVFYGGKVKKS